VNGESTCSDTNIFDVAMKTVTFKLRNTQFAFQEISIISMN
jgi:hypothetical protein